MTDGAERKSNQGWLSILGWAAYLACSWTWCIGMFLPVLLARDYGIWGFVVFAVPNVIGAGAMGWVLRDGASERIAAAHAAMARWFSIVTVMFHAFFFPWLILSTVPDLDDPGASLAWPTAFASLAITSFVLLCLRRFRSAATLVWLVSVSCAIAMLQPGSGLAATRGELLPMQAVSDIDLAMLAPVCAFGFLLCPYLDLTFHRTAQRTDRFSRRTAFSIGFGALFLAMILVTLVYAGPLIGATRASGPLRFPFGILFVAIVIHIGVQTVFTVVVHHVEYRRSIPRSVSGWWKVVLVLACMTIAPAIGVRQLEEGGRPLSFHGIQINELVYRLFMSFYGLLFPAYVWLCMIPVRGEPHTQPPTRQKLLVLAIACTLAAPCYWMGFIERETIWLAPGLGVVLVARLFIKKSMNEAPSPATGGYEAAMRN